MILMKYFLTLSFVVVLSTITTAQFSTKEEQGKNECALLDCVVIIDENSGDTIPPPRWSDSRIWNSDGTANRAGRESIISEATTNAFMVLGKVGDQSWINQFTMAEPYQSSYHYFKIEYDENDNNRKYLSYYTWIFGQKDFHKQKIKFDISYVPMNRTIQVAAKSQPFLAKYFGEYTEKNILTRNGEYQDFKYCNEIDVNASIPNEGVGYRYRDYWEYYGLPKTIGVENDLKCKTCPICYREEIIVKIEIYPEVFNRGKLCIPSEKQWAENCVDAMTYIILHELGHIESFISKKSKLRKLGHNLSLLLEQDNSEDAAWQFATNIAKF